jgi:hypothetical protein
MKQSFCRGHCGIRNNPGKISVFELRRGKLNFDDLDCFLPRNDGKDKHINELSELQSNEG